MRALGCSIIISLILIACSSDDTPKFVEPSKPSPPEIIKEVPDFPPAISKCNPDYECL